MPYDFFYFFWNLFISILNWLLELFGIPILT